MVFHLCTRYFDLLDFLEFALVLRAWEEIQRRNNTPQSSLMAIMETEKFLVGEAVACNGRRNKSCSVFFVPSRSLMIVDYAMQLIFQLNSDVCMNHNQWWR